MLWGYANLAKHLGDDQPVYAFNSQSRDGSGEFATIEEMPAQYVKELRTFQPQGPYYLGGYCFGGEVAFEMAQQLAATGQRVALLALFNAMPPNSSSEKISLAPLWIARFARNSWHWFRYYCQWTPDQRRTFTERKLRALKKRLGRLWSRNAAPKVEAEDQVDLALYSEDQRRLWDVHLRASATYHPRPYPGNVTVFRTRTHPFFSSFDPSFGWSEFARGGVTVKIIPGAHESILDEPHVRVAAAELNRCLELAQREGARHEDVPSPRATEIKMLLSSVLWVLEMTPAV
ncbi:MAG: thioesterase domain-containing protein [Verrucomicrobia subdivision 3 bacterium]|nr:thioesterase domain-containing protein [Limisphaerales bacterium]